MIPFRGGIVSKLAVSVRLFDFTVIPPDANMTEGTLDLATVIFGNIFVGDDQRADASKLKDLFPVLFFSLKAMDEGLNGVKIVVQPGAVRLSVSLGHLLVGEEASLFGLEKRDRLLRFIFSSTPDEMRTAENFL